MARGFGSTLGVGTTDKIVAASYTSPTLFSYAGWVNRNADGTLSAGRIFSKDGSTTGEIAARRSASTVMTLSRKFSTTQGDWTVTGTSLDTAGRWNHLAIAYDGGATGNVPVVYVNGMAVSVATLVTPAGTVTSSAGVLNIGNVASSVREWDGILGDQAFWSGVLLSAAEVEALYNGANPRDIRGNYLQELISMTSLIPASLVKATQPITRGTKIRPDRLALVQGRAFPFGQATASGITGTASITEAGDTVSSTSTLAIAATLASSEAGDTVSSAATLALAASASITEAGDTVASTATLALAATAAITEAGDSLSSTAAASIAAVLAATEAGDASSATAALAIVANASITEAGDMLSATGVGVVTSTGTAAITEADDTAASVATLKIAGAAAITEAGDTTAAIATLAIKATLAANDNDDTLSATATMGTVAVASRSTGSRPSEGTSTLRLNLSGGPRPSAISRGSR